MEGKKRRPRATKAVKPEDPIPNGKEIVDSRKRKWKFGHELGSGGCGVVYEGSDGSSSAFNYVIKIEHHQNGPLFTEIHVYHNIGKEDTINQFMKKKKLNHLGIPACFSTGSFDHNNKKYRFMVLQKFGKDLQHIMDENHGMLHPKTVFTVGRIVINALEYMHSQSYIHGDIKAGNLLLGPNKDKINDVYLLDMGLATRYITKEGVLKGSKPDPKRANNGTPEFMSRDAHAGVVSRRSDLEILAYNMLLWLSGSLPWINSIKDLAKTKEEKNRYMNDVPLMMKNLLPKAKYPEFEKFLVYVNQLKVEEEPNYDYCISLFSSSVKGLRLKDDGILILKGVAKIADILGMFLKERVPQNLTDGSEESSQDENNWQENIDEDYDPSQSFDEESSVSSQSSGEFSSEDYEASNNFRKTALADSTNINCNKQTAKYEDGKVPSTKKTQSAWPQYPHSVSTDTPPSTPPASPQEETEPDVTASNKYKARGGIPTNRERAVKNSPASNICEEANRKISVSNKSAVKGTQEKRNEEGAEASYKCKGTVQANRKSDVDAVTLSSDSSLKENNGKKHRKKRGSPSTASSSTALNSGEVLTPAMLAVLNRQQERAAEKAPKKPRKKSP